MTQGTCEKCEGRGFIVGVLPSEPPCPRCLGTGRQLEPRGDDMEHTPIPWDVKVKGVDDAAIWGPDSQFILDMPRGMTLTTVSFPMGPANAAFIVRAVNNHAKLLGALGKVVKRAEMSNTVLAHEIAAPARKAIREANK